MNNGTSYNLHYYVGLLLSLVVCPLAMETTHTGSLTFIWAYQMSYLKAAGVYAADISCFVATYIDRAENVFLNYSFMATYLRYLEIQVVTR